MKYLVVFALLLGAAVSATAQVSSHAPTGAASPTKPSAAPTDSSFQVSDKPVARVNGATLTDRDLLREMMQIFPYANTHGGFPKAEEASIRQGALQMIIFEELVYQEALRRKLTVPPPQVRQAQLEFKKQFHSPQEYQQYLNVEMGGSKQNVVNKITRSLLIEQMLKLEVENKSAVTMAEARVNYDKNPGKFQVPESFSFQSISVLPPQKPTADQKQEAWKRSNEDLKLAKATKSFQEFGLVAEKVSEDDFRVNMGDHKAVEKDKLPPQVVKALLALKPGQVTDVIQIDQAYTIIRLNTHTPATKKSFEQVKSGFRTELQKSKYEQLRVALDKRLRASAKVEVL